MTSVPDPIPNNLPTIAELVPHSGPMRLLDAVLALAPGEIVAGVTPRADSLFCNTGQIGAWVGIEYMAQAMAALAGWEARERGEPVKPGLLLGTRKYVCHVSGFALGEPLSIHAKHDFAAGNGMTMMACEIRAADGKLLAEATLSVLQPDNFDTLLQNNQEQQA
ncbi:ApeP family dehydratase [Andreprevotia chitinilytica]|uniref:ApeP family dehydratase n=1 Tax=Andreprevotia chitinilytica TaxID=396808 RepID=UPI00068B22A2|nr:hypothetical protein [Andreprevotia chitinilytica]